MNTGAVGREPEEATKMRGTSKMTRSIRVASINHSDHGKGRLRLELMRATDCDIPDARGYRWISTDREGKQEVDDQRLDSVSEAMAYLRASYPSSSAWGLRVGR